MFKDRVEAGRALSQKLKTLVKDKERTIVLAIPRGGVIVAKEVAASLNLEMSIVSPRKLGAPYNPELAIGAVSPDGDVYLNKDIVELVGASKEYIEQETKIQLAEAKRRMIFYTGNIIPSIKDKDVILVDDGIATGATMCAAIRYVRKKGARKVIVASPVASPEAYELIKKEADEVVCLMVPEIFFAVGEFYEDFRQVSDEEVIEILRSFNLRSFG